jgi:hypothetical protein
MFQKPAGAKLQNVRRKPTKNMMPTLNRQILIILTIVLSNCTEIMYLKDGSTKVPRKPTFFKKDKNFDRTVFNTIDTSSVYKEIVSLRKDYMKPLRPFFINKYSIYRFYGNGCFNLFYSENNDTTFTAQEFDPNYTGWRGKLHLEYDDLFGKIYMKCNYDSTSYATDKYFFHFTEDTLFVRAGNDYGRVYLKKKVSDSLLKTNANW